MASPADSSNASGEFPPGERTDGRLGMASRPASAALPPPPPPATSTRLSALRRFKPLGRSSLSPGGTNAGSGVATPSGLPAVSHQVSTQALLPVVQPPQLRRKPREAELRSVAKPESERETLDRGEGGSLPRPASATRGDAGSLGGVGSSGVDSESGLRDEVAQCLQELEGPFMRLMENPALLDAWQHARRIFHTLYGTLATCGPKEWSIPAGRAEVDCKRAVMEPAVRNWESLSRCRADADELARFLAAPRTENPDRVASEAVTPLPETLPDVEAGGQGAGMPGEGNREFRVLVVDDSRSVRRLETRLLTDWGYRVTAAVDGQDAWERLLQAADGEFDLILTDLEMPRLNGLQLLRKLSEDPRWRDVPKLVVSSSTRHGIQTEVQALGAGEFLAKPFREERLREALQRLLPRPTLSHPEAASSSETASGTSASALHP